MVLKLNWHTYIFCEFFTDAVSLPIFCRCGDEFNHPWAPTDACCESPELVIITKVYPHLS